MVVIALCGVSGSGERAGAPTENPDRRPGRDGLSAGVDGPRLRVAVTEAPENGRANRAVCAALAAALGIPVSVVEVTQGVAAREKTLRISGDPTLLIPRIEALA